MRDPIIRKLTNVERLMWLALALVAASGVAGALWH